MPCERELFRWWTTIMVSALSLLRSSLIELIASQSAISCIAARARLTSRSDPPDGQFYSIDRPGETDPSEALKSETVTPGEAQVRGHPLAARPPER